MLSERDRKILCAVVQSYIGRPEPVGSRHVSKRYGMNLSPATIRNVMADLDEMGYLSQPHTSAGRVPTDKGYRYYVDCLCREGTEVIEEDAASGLRRKLETTRADLENMLREATRTLSRMSHYIVFAAPVRTDDTTLNRIQLIRYRDKRVVSVVLTDEGVIKSRILGTNFGLTQRDLNRISDFLNSEFSGFTLDEVRSRLIRQLSKEKALCDILISQARSIFREVLDIPANEIFVSGISDFLGLPDFADRINDIARAIEDKHFIIKLLDRIAASDGVQVLIGAENPIEQLRRMSVVVAPYKYGSRVLGSVGMIGPTRMDYPRAISMVEITAKCLTDAFSG